MCSRASIPCTATRSSARHTVSDKEIVHAEESTPGVSAGALHTWLRVTMLYCLISAFKELRYGPRGPRP